MAFKIALINVAVLIALSIPGYFLMKIKKLKNAHIQALVVILIYAAQPAMVAKSFLSLKFTAEKGLNILISIGVFLLVMLLVLMCACVIFRKWKTKKSAAGVCGDATATGGNNSSNTAATGVDNSSSATATGGNNSSNTAATGGNNSSDATATGGNNSSDATATGVDNSSSAMATGNKCANIPDVSKEDGISDTAGDMFGGKTDAAGVENTDAAARKKEKIPARIKNREEDDRLYRFASMFGNTGYLGLPLVSVLFPGNAVMLLYTSICIVTFNLLSWTVGVYVITGDKKYVSFKKGLLNPVPIATVITLPFFFIPFNVPGEIVKVFDILGSMTTPISMIIMGARMAQIPFREVFSDYKVYIVCFLRLIAAPMIAFGLLKLFNITDKDLFNTVLIICAMPTAAAAIVFSERFLTGSYTAMKAVLCSSVLCIVTIPLFFTLFLIA